MKKWECIPFTEVTVLGEIDELPKKVISRSKDTSNSSRRSL